LAACQVKGESAPSGDVGAGIAQIEAFLRNS